MEKGITDEQLKKDLAFDQYGRYAIIRDIINTNRKNSEKFKVLDVGGRGNLMRKFLPKDNVFYLDPYVDTSDDNYIKGNGCDMPIKDNSFDWVVSADVFEHIKPKERENFLNENIRVSKLGTILAAPFYSKEIQKAEINVNENYKIFSDGKDDRWLKEHIAYGLPLEDELENFLRSIKLEFQKISNNRLFLWEIFLPIYFFYVNNSFDKEIQKAFKNFNYSYNTKIFPIDSSEPSYRKVYFIKKEKNLESKELKEKISLENIAVLDILKEGFDLLAKIEKNNKKSISKKNIKLAEKDREVTQKIREVNEKNAEIQMIVSSLRWRVPEYFYEIYKDRVKKYVPGFVFKIVVVVQDFFSDKKKKMENERHIKKILGAKISDTEILKFEEYDKTKVSIIIPVFNRWQFTYNCLKSIREKISNLKYEIIIVDNASSDHTKKLFEKIKGVKYFRNSKNLGFSKACNRGAEKAESDYLLFLNNDTAFKKNNCIDAMMDELDKNKKASIVGCKLLFSNDTIQHAGVFFAKDKIPRHLFYKKKKNKRGANKRMVLDAVTGACLMIRKKDFFSMGGFDENYINGLEDIDLCLKIRDAGKETVYRPDSVIYHYESISEGRFDYAKENTELFLKKWGEKIIPGKKF